MTHCKHCLDPMTIDAPHSYETCVARVVEQRNEAVALAVRAAAVLSLLREGAMLIKNTEITSLVSRISAFASRWNRT